MTFDSNEMVWRGEFASGGAWGTELVSVGPEPSVASYTFVGAGSFPTQQLVGTPISMLSSLAYLFTECY